MTGLSMEQESGGKAPRLFGYLKDSLTQIGVETNQVEEAQVAQCCLSTGALFLQAAGPSISFHSAQNLNSTV